MRALQINEWGKIIQSHTGQLSSTFGASVTPGNNTYGSWATVLASGSVTDDVYAIEVIVHGIGVSGSATDSLTNIGVDPAGGTSFSVLIPDLLTSSAATIGLTQTPGISFWFPVKIKAGSTIGAQGSINNATVGTQRVFVKLYCCPSRPDQVRSGSYVLSFGANAAASCGTAVTAGGASEGSYTQLGSSVADNGLFFWVVASAPINQNTMANGAHCSDLALGDASNKRVIIADQIEGTDNSERRTAIMRGAWAKAAVGDNVYTRCQTGTAVTANSSIAYAVGG